MTPTIHTPIVESKDGVKESEIQFDEAGRPYVLTTKTFTIEGQTITREVKTYAETDKARPKQYVR